jgi:hypothetical protein
LLDVTGLGGLYSWRYGERPYSGYTLHDLPTVALTTPTSEQVFTTGGPSITFAWDYDQAQQDPQVQYRLVITDDADATTFYDSGWVASAAASESVNLMDNGVSGDDTNVSARVYVRSVIGSEAWQADSGLVPFQLRWGEPAIVVTEPDAVENTLTISAEWDYSDSEGKAQGEYRVRLLTADGVQLHDSGWVASAATSYAIPTELADETQYQVGIQVKNTEGVASVTLVAHQFGEGFGDGFDG